MRGSEDGPVGDRERCDVPSGDVHIVDEEFEAASMPGGAAYEAAERAAWEYERETRRRERHPAEVEYRDAAVSYQTDGLGRLLGIVEALAFDDVGRPARLTEAELAARSDLSIEALRADFAEFLRDRDSDLGDAAAEYLLSRSEAR